MIEFAVLGGLKHQPGDPHSGRHVGRVTLILPIALAGLLSAPAASDQAELPAPIYSPWTKFCINETCFIGKDVRTECAPIFAVVLIENAKDTKKILRVTLPTSVNTDRGARIAIDQAQPITRPFERCYANGCMADYAAGAELVDQLKQGRTLTLDAVDAAMVRQIAPSTPGPPNCARSSVLRQTTICGPRHSWWPGHFIAPPAL